MCVPCVWCPQNHNTSLIATFKNNVQKRAYKTVIENDTSKITLPTPKNDEKMDNTHKNEISKDFGSLQEKICGSENFYYLHDRATHFLDEIPKLREIQRTHVPCPFCDLLFLDDFYMQVHMGLEHMPNFKKTVGSVFSNIRDNTNLLLQSWAYWIFCCICKDY